MSVAVPKIGSRVRVTTRDKEYYVYATKEWRDTTFEGVVEKSIFNDPFYFAVRTGNEFYPVSEFNAKSERLVKIEYLVGGAMQVATDTKAWRVKSSNGKKSYLVSRVNGKFSCTCDGFSFRKDCKHIKAASMAKK